jgi:hypothetical protein
MTESLEIDPREAEVQLDIIRELSEVLDAHDIEFWLLGGWALDFLIGELTRRHDDVDVFVWDRDWERIHDLLLGRGYRFEEEAAGPYDHESVHYTKNEQWLELVRVIERPDGELATPGRFLDWPWPRASFAAERVRFRDLAVRVFDAEGQLYIKTGFKEHGEKAPPRPKDLLDIARLRELVGT